MEITTLRDWVLVIFGFLGIGAIILFITLLIITYRKIRRILDSVKEAVDGVRNTASTFSKSILQPIVRIQGFVAGIRKAAEVVTAMNQRDVHKGRRKNER